MVSDIVIRRLWEITRPESNEWAAEYLKKLRYVLNIPKKKRFLTAFDVTKKTGGTRKIVPATPSLAFVQSVLANWMVLTYPGSHDYCYTGKGVLQTVRPHLGSKSALVIDLKSAFDHVTYARLKFALRKHHTNLDPDVVEVICDLLTFPVYSDTQTTPQGCVSTPYAYNLVVRPIDLELMAVAAAYPGMRITRYSDNICLSTPEVIDLKALEKKVTSIIYANGFQVSWSKSFDKPPFKYLGTLIYPDSIQLDEEKYGEFSFVLMEALASATPNIYRNQIVGIFNWAMHVSGKKMPDDLFELFRRYFEKVRRPPASFSKLVVERTNLRF